MTGIDQVIKEVRKQLERKDSPVGPVFYVAIQRSDIIDHFPSMTDEWFIGECRAVGFDAHLDPLKNQFVLTLRSTPH